MSFIISRIFLVSSLIIPVSSHGVVSAGLGIAPLLELVAGQVQELEHLSRVIGFAEEQKNLILELNRGINRTISQIQAIESIVERSQRLDPSSINSLKDLNDQLDQGKAVLKDANKLLLLKTSLASQAVKETALQSQTTYTMGQEMIAVGSELSKESQTASPGRAAQITAAASSAGMLSKGVELQMLSKIAEVTALSLELQRSELEQKVISQSQSRNFFKSALRSKRKTKKRRLP